MPAGLSGITAITVATDPRKVARAAALGIAVHDHLIIGRSGHASLKTLGLI